MTLLGGKVKVAPEVLFSAVMLPHAAGVLPPVAGEPVIWVFLVYGERTVIVPFEFRVIEVGPV